jgi:hypothetical protein
MGAMADADGGARALLTRPWQLLLAGALLVGAPLASIGETIGAFGAPKLGVVDDWGRIDEAARQVAAWPYLLALVLVVILLHAITTADAAPHGLWLAVGIELVLFVAACILGIVALSKRLADEPEPGTAGRSYHTDGEVTGETITYVALILVALVMIGVVSQHLRASDAEGTQESST